jgi:hypothetical protein
MFTILLHLSNCMRLLLDFNIVIFNFKPFNFLSLFCGVAEVVTDVGLS